MVVFTGSDKSLLDRAARHLAVEAKKLGWETIADSRKRKAAKLEFDRLTRDERDLRMLGIRLVNLAKALGPEKLGGGFATQDRPADTGATTNG